MIELKSVGRTYGKKAQAFTALEDITYAIPSGTSVAIVGKSGSGKSTLMHIKSGLDRPTSGTVLVDDQDISKLKNKALDKFRAEKIGFIFQAFFVQANETTYQNVSLPLEISGVKPTERKNRIREALEQVELDVKSDTTAGKLSGGQKQRLAIARAIVGNPSIIFADEPTGNLDSTTGAKVEDLLFGFNKQHGTTLVIVTHDHDLAARCDMQMHIKDGKIVKTTGAKS